MRKNIIIIVLFILPVVFAGRQLMGQSGETKVVILGSSHAKSCNFTDTTQISFMNHSVADFTCKQLFWTLSHGVIAHEPDICVLQTGGLDVLLGIPPEEVLKFLKDFSEELDVARVKLVIVEDFPYWQGDVLNSAFLEMNIQIKNFCDEHNIKYLPLKTAKITPEEINPGGNPILSNSGAEKFSKTLIKFLTDEK